MVYTDAQLGRISNINTLFSLHNKCSIPVMLPGYTVDVTNLINNSAQKFLEGAATSKRDIVIKSLKNLDKTVTEKQKYAIIKILQDKNKAAWNAMNHNELRQALKNDKDFIHLGSVRYTKKLFYALQTFKKEALQHNTEELCKLIKQQNNIFSKLGIDHVNTGICTGISVIVNINDLLSGKYGNFFTNVGVDTASNIAVTIIDKALEKSVINKLPGSVGVAVSIFVDGCRCAYTGDLEKFAKSIPKTAISTAASMTGAAVAQSTVVYISGIVAPALVLNPWGLAIVGLVGGVSLCFGINYGLKDTKLYQPSKLEKIQHSKNLIAAYNEQQRKDGSRWFINENVNLEKFFDEIQKGDKGRIMLTEHIPIIFKENLTNDQISKLALSFCPKNLDKGLLKLEHMLRKNLAKSVAYNNMKISKL